MKDDKKIKSLVKGISWRFIATLITVSLVYYWTRRLEILAAFALFETVLKVAAYYLHERFWNHVSWGVKE